MSRVLTNNTGVSYAIEDTENNLDNLGFIAGETPPGGSPIAGAPEWFQVEPNDITNFGATISKVARQPISKNRQRRKGTTTDLDSAVEFPADLTLSSFQDFIEGFCFATAVNADMDIPSSAAETTGDTYTVASLAAAQANKLEFSLGEYATLVHARGFSNSGNNGLKQLDTDVAAAATAIPVAENLVDEPSPPANAQVELAGLRLLDGVTDLSYTFSGTEATLTIGVGIAVFDWADFGIAVGMVVHLGSPDGSGGVQNALQNTVANDQFGYGRVKSLNGKVMVLDKLDTALQNTLPTIPATVDILFGKFVRNVPTDDADYIQRSFQFEAEYPDLGGPGTDEYQYAKGNFCNTVSFELPLTDKATATFGFIGTDTDNPTGTRKTNAATAAAPLSTEAMNTSSDIARLRITEVDETGLTTDFKSLTLTLNNNVSPEKVIGTLGARFMNAGNFEVNVEAELLFTDGEVVAAIRANRTVTMDFGVKNNDGAIFVDIPSMTLGGGERQFPVNESVIISAPGEAFGDAVLNTSIGITIFPVVP